MALRQSTVCPGNRPFICRQVSVAVSLTSPQNNSWVNVSSACLRPFGQPNLLSAYDARLVDIWACGIVYYCLHFQELPWRAAQTTDTLYLAYANACASTSPATSNCPPTINNLNPRSCRPLLRKMLEPDPKKRFAIEEVIKHSWLESIEVCHLVENPQHVHVHARALAQTQLRELKDGN